MNPEKRIGKIKSVRFGHGGYQDAMIGISFDLGSETGWGVGDFWGAWAIEHYSACKWTPEDRLRQVGETVMRINALLSDAKVHDIADLKDKPVEVIIEGNTLKSWRILTEVI